MSLNESEKNFLKNMGISVERYVKANISIDKLVAIAEDYIKDESNLLDEAEYIAKKLQRCRSVHSVRWRVKDVSHLIEKIIRKRELDDVSEKYKNIDVTNYKTVITDLIGVRAIHLFKSDWLNVHQHILSRWPLKDDVVIYYREGDDLSLYQDEGNTCKKEVHNSGYRSIHYIVPAAKFDSQQIYCEIQTRTIFEEGWSEIDHKVRYPSFSDNLYLQQYLNIFNRLAGSADEMGSYVNIVKDLIQKTEIYDAYKLESQEKIIKLEKTVEKLIKEKADYEKIEEAYEQLKQAKEQEDLLNSQVSDDIFNVAQKGLEPYLSAQKAAGAASIIQKQVGLSSMLARQGLAPYLSAQKAAGAASIIQKEVGLSSMLARQGLAPYLSAQKAAGAASIIQKEVGLSSMLARQGLAPYLSAQKAAGAASIIQKEVGLSSMLARQGLAPYLSAQKAAGAASIIQKQAGLSSMFARKGFEPYLSAQKTADTMPVTQNQMMTFSKSIQKILGPYFPPDKRIDLSVILNRKKKKCIDD